MEIYLLIFCAVYVFFIATGHILFRFVALNNEKKEDFLLHMVKETAYNPYELARQNSWFKKIGELEKKSLDSSDGKKMSAYYRSAEKKTHKWIICLHDYGTDARFMAPYIEILEKYDYNLLLPDAYGCGQSDGKILGLGFADRFDLLKWCELIAQEDTQAEIVCYGMGSGAATALFVASEKNPSQLKGIVADSSYAGLWEAILSHLIPLISSLSKIVGNFANTEYSFRRNVRNSWRKGDLWHKIENCKTPILYIHGEKDYLFPIKHFEVLEENTKAPHWNFRVSEAGHISSIYAEPANYKNKVEEFLQNCSFV